MYARVLAAALTFALALATGSAEAQPDSKDAIKCKAGIVKASSAFSQARAKALAKCEESVVKDKLPAATDCVTEAKTVAAITKAVDKINAAIVKACGGKDKVCGTGDDVPLADVGWNLGTCPNFENGTCNQAITSCTNIAGCLLCIDNATVDQAIGLYYDALVDTDAKTQKALNKCQVSIGKNNNAYLLASSKALAKCWDSLNKGKVTSCPDDKATAAIGKADAKRVNSICKDCGGANKACGGGDDLTIAEIGFPGTCEALDPPGTQGSCGGAVTNLPELVACTGCITNFKLGCSDLAAVPGLTGGGVPGECNPGAVDTPTPTLTPTPTATPTETSTPEGPTQTPTPTVTVTPGGTCGNGQLDTGEDCDGSIGGGAGTTCDNSGNGLEVCTSSCTCACPSRIEFTGNSTDPASLLDTGWTGQAHDARVISDGTLTVAVTDCPASPDNSKPCGVCDIAGPIPNENAGTGDVDNQRCSTDTSKRCTTNADCNTAHCVGGTNEGGACTVDAQCTGGGDCAAAGTCEFFFGSLLPLSAGGVSTCVSNQVTGAVTGTVNVETGTAASNVNLISRVANGIVVPQPCPQCNGDPTPNDGVKGGTCLSGPRNGLSCDANGNHPFPSFGTTSFDCPFADGAILASLPIALTNSTGTETKTLAAAGPNCTAAGFTGLECFCDTCNNAAATICDEDADCIAVGATTCGGLRCLPGSPAALVGTPCTTVGASADCRRCNGGSNAGNPCTAAGQCPGGTCPVALCGRPGQPSAPNACTDATCSPLGGSPDLNEGECAAGPSDSHCEIELFRSCSTSAECPATGDSCVTTQRECFTDNGVAGASVTATGEADAPVNDSANPTLASLFCIGPVGSAVNSAAGLPGLGRLQLKGTALGLP